MGATRRGRAESHGPFLGTRVPTLGNSHASPTLIRFMQSYAGYCCLGFAPSVERLLSGFLLSDAPGSSFEVPLVPVDVPLAPESIEPVPEPTDLEGLGVGFELDAGFPPWGAVSAAKAGAAANSAATAAATKVVFIGERFLPFFIR